MTHNTDCTIKPEAAEDVQRVAELIYEGSRQEAVEVAENELGWELVGGGAGRRVFRVSQDHQDGPHDHSTHEAPCVVKFATPGRGFGDGRTQNKREFEQYRAFPDEMTDPDDGIPIVVPIKDHDDEFHWLSMPEVDARGGSSHEIQTRLAQAGWHCDDLHRDNIGNMHGESVVLDYGLDCEERGKPMEVAKDIEHELGKIDGIRDITLTEQNDGGVRVTFKPPDWALETSRPMKLSVIHVDSKAMFRFMEIIVGRYEKDPTAYEPEVMEAANGVARDVQGSWHEIEVFPSLNDQDGAHEVEFEVEYYGHDAVGADIVADMAKDVIYSVHEAFPGGEMHDLEPDVPEPLDPEVGMVLDHPEFVNEVTIVEVDDDSVIGEDTSGYEWELLEDHYPELTEDMLVGRRQEVPPEEAESIQLSIEEAVDRAVEDEETQTEILEEIGREIDDAMLTRG